MQPPSRRRFLAAVGTSVALGLAGCSDAEAEFLVTDIQQVHGPRYDEFDYPEDILYRLSIENTGPNRQRGTLEMELVYDPGNGDGQSWSKADDLTLPRGTSVQKEYVFEDVFVAGRDIEAYRLDAEIREL